MRRWKKCMAVSLAAFSLVAFAPRFDAPPCLAAKVIDDWGAPEDPYGLYFGTGLPLMVRSQYLSAEVVGGRAHWSGLWFFEHPGEMERMAEVLGEYSAEEREEALAGNRQLAVKSLLVHRADTQVVSFVESTAAYRGGIRGRYVLSGRNFDVAEGRELTFSDVFRIDDPYDLASLIASKLRADYPDARFMKDGGEKLDDRIAKSIEAGTISWTLEQRGATFYFNSRSFDMRPPEDAVDTMYTATVFFDERPELFDAAFRRGQGSWCLELDWAVPVWVQFGDGQKSRIEVHGDAGGFHITIDGESFVDPEPVRGVFRPVLLSIKGGRRYLYVDELVPDENRGRLRIYDLNGGGIRRVPWEGSLTMLASDASDGNLREWLIMTNPKNFTLYNPSGEDGREFCFCRLDEDGTPKIVREQKEIERGEEGAPLIWPYNR